MHGCSGLYKKSGQIKTNSAAWISRFVKWGHVVLAVDGFTPRGFRSMCGKQKRPLHALDDRPFDAYGGLAWLKNQPFIKKDQIILIGWSNGAMAALSGLRENKAEYFGEGHRFKAVAAFYPGCITLRRRVNNRLKPYAPVLVFVGLADNWTWPKPCIKLIRQAAEDGFVARYVAAIGAVSGVDQQRLHHHLLRRNADQMDRARARRLFQGQFQHFRLCHCGHLHVGPRRHRDCGRGLGVRIVAVVV